MPFAAVNLIKPFWDICKLKRMPQDIPESRFLFNVVLCTYLLLSTVFNLIGSTITEACLFSLLMTTLLLVFIRILLLTRQYDRRMLQTATALMGTSIVLFPASFALRYWFYVIENSGTESNLAGYLWICLFIWERFISAHILRHALDIRFIFGFLISVGYVCFEYQVIVVFHRAVTQWLT
tara:strand:- start:857 stop:1396 length:540 start_codon:yes stop_codon:yes gene_type:complete